ncbi:hypothetical protein D2926_11645 [Vibrio cholerae]|nr:hypothetical protein [Vibrio cholerae]TLE24553.1 hypothetical protein D2926_11645 [Vibrio cholerae]TLE29333.1 hypothetical protein D2927_12255 [Vibrio cholerae]TLE34476.1 hypothetical protein D2928_11670 [Vibrio cholerae]TLE48818.1 hypothetical protein D2929_08065 [Vibrio cholerae]TLE55451.1 hypothetical protein D2930_11745 [Vibrio cholerae]
MALTKGQPMAVQICSRQICHSLAAYLQLQVVWVYIIFAPKLLRPFTHSHPVQEFSPTKTYPFF